MRDIIEEKYVSSLPMLLGAVLLFVASSALAFAVYAHKGTRPDGGPLYDTASIVVFEKSNCDRCDQLRAGVAKKYLASEMAGKASLRYFDITDGPPPRRFKLKRDVTDAPTIVVFDIYGREETRYSGVPDTVADLEKLAYYAVRRAERELQRNTR